MLVQKRRRHSPTAPIQSSGLQPGVHEDIMERYEDSFPNSGAGLPETSSIISLTDQNYIHNLLNILLHNFA
jgi:hypothetical protein